jgi:hypothetical protein
MPNPDRCPADPEETAEAYLLHHLTPAEVQAFEDHCITCARCAEILEQTERYVIAMKRAAERLRGE